MRGERRGEAFQVSVFWIDCTAREKTAHSGSRQYQELSGLGLASSDMRDARERERGSRHGWLCG